MKATLQPNDPVPALMDELVDGLHLLHVCRARGVADLERLLEYIEYTLDQIECHRLGRSSDLFFDSMSPTHFVGTNSHEELEWCD